MTGKICNVCGNEKDEQNFTKGKNTCKDCRNNDRKALYLKQKQTSEKVCKRCNTSKLCKLYDKDETVCKSCCDDIFNIYNNQLITGRYRRIKVHNGREYKMTEDQSAKYSNIQAFEDMSFHESMHNALVRS